MEFLVVFFWTNGTALFSTKETKSIEPYHLMGIFGCQWAGVWVHIMTTRNMVELPVVLDVLLDDLENCFSLEKKATISSFGCCRIHISSGKPAISIHIFFPRCSSCGSTLESRIMQVKENTSTDQKNEFDFTCRVAVVF